MARASQGTLAAVPKRNPGDWFPAYNPGRRSRNLSLCCVGWCSLFTLTMLAIAIIVTMQRGMYLYGTCSLDAFSSPCHFCWESPMAEEPCTEFDIDDRTCHFQVKAKETEGSAVYFGPYMADFEAESIYNPENLVPTNPAFDCCPEDFTCCSWQVETFGSHGEFCDAQCQEGVGGWACRWRVENEQAVEVHYWVEDHLIWFLRMIVVVLGGITVFFALDPFYLRGRPLKEVEDKPAVKRKKLTVETHAGDGPKLPDGPKWTPRTAREAQRALLSPLPLEQSQVDLSQDDQSSRPNSRSHSVPPQSMVELATHAQRRARRAKSAPRVIPNEPVFTGRDGQTALARADWAKAQREGVAATKKRGLGSPPRPKRSTFSAWG